MRTIKKYNQITIALISSIVCVIAYGYLDFFLHTTMLILQGFMGNLSESLFALFSGGEGSFLAILFLVLSPFILWGLILFGTFAYLISVSPIITALILNKIICRQNPLTMKTRMILVIVWLISLLVFLLIGIRLPDINDKIKYSINMNSLFVAMIVNFLWLLINAVKMRKAGLSIQRMS